MSIIVDHISEFSRIIAHYGLSRYLPEYDDPRLPEAILRAQCRVRAEQLIESHRSLPGGGLMPHVHFDYIDDPSANAKAFFTRTTGCGYIGMFTGAVALIYDMFYRMLAHPKVLPRIGTAAAEFVRQPFHSEGLRQDYNELLASRGPKGGRLPDVKPLDERRCSYAETLAGYAFDFLILHELCHIRHGHLQLALDHGISFISELDLSARKSGLTTDQYMMLQAMEMDADAFATLASFRLHAEDPGNEFAKIFRSVIDAGPPGGWPNSIVRTDELMAFDWCYAVQSLFWMFGLGFDPASLELNAHPPAPQRGLNALGLLVNTALVVNKEKSVWIGQIGSKAFTAVRDATTSLNGDRRQPEVNEIIRAFGVGGLFAKHLEKMKGKWTEIRPDLLKYSFVQGLAP